MALCPTGSSLSRLRVDSYLDSFDARDRRSDRVTQHRSNATDAKGQGEPPYFSPFSSGFSFLRNVKAQPAAVSLS